MVDMMPVSPRVYLDTSVIVAAIIVRSPRHQPSSEILKKIADDGATVCVSQLVHAELLQSLVALATTPYALSEQTRRQFRLHRWGDVLDVRRRWLRHAMELRDTLFTQFRRVEEIGITREITREAITVMAESRLKSYDAVHVASAIWLQSAEIITSDRDFERVNVHGLTIRTIS